MIPIVEAARPELARLCERFRVQRLELFGSAAEGRFDPDSSDLDFLVAFQPLPPAEHADCYFGLLDALGALFRRRIDLTELPPIQNPYYLRSIEPTRVVLHNIRSMQDPSSGAPGASPSPV